RPSQPRRLRMKAIRVHAPGGPEVLKLDDLPEPQPKVGEAIVKVDAAGLNFIDVYQRSGLYKLDMPLALGLEAGGTVTAVGTGVHVVYDSVGKDTWDGSLNCCAVRGMIALYGQSSGPIGQIDPQILNAKGSLFLTRPSLFHYIATREELQQRAGELFGWIRE